MFRFSAFISVLLLSSCTNFLFFPVKPFPVTPGSADLLYEDLSIETADGLSLHGWKIYAEKEKKGSILFFHGNGDNISTQLPNTFWLAKEGYDLYVYDYREYGQSQGSADLDDTIMDMELMISNAVEQLPDQEKLIVLGHSLGAAMAIYTVAHSEHREKIAALITVAAFGDYHEVTQDVLSESWLFWLFQWPLSFTVDNSYRPLDAVGMISPIPLAIIHSETDEIIPMYHAENLYQAAEQPKTLLLINSNHNNVFVSKDNRQILFDYLKTLKNQ